MCTIWILQPSAARSQRIPSGICLGQAKQSAGSPPAGQPGHNDEAPKVLPLARARGGTGPLSFNAFRNSNDCDFRSSAEDGWQGGAPRPPPDRVARRLDSHRDLWPRRIPEGIRWDRASLGCRIQIVHFSIIRILRVLSILRMFRILRILSILSIIWQNA